MVDQTQPKQQAVQAVIFDLDGVLIDSEWIAFQAWCRWTEARGGALQEAHYPCLTGLSAEETAAYVMRHTGLVFDIQESYAWTSQWVLSSIQRGCEPVPGSLELVRSLAARGCPLAIASNSPAGYVDQVLAGIGMQKFFPIRVTLEQVARGKPAPDVYLRAAQCLAVDSQRCIAIEDSHVGVQAASAAGMRVIAVPGAHDDPHSFHGAWRVYPSLLNVLPDLDSILLAE